MNTNRNADTANVIIYFADKDTFYSVTDGTMKPMARKVALAAIAHTSALVTSGNMSTFAVSAVSA